MSLITGAFSSSAPSDTSPSLASPSLAQRNIPVSTITPRPPSRTDRAEVGMEEWLGFYGPRQPMNVPPFFRSEGWPIRAGRCDLRFCSALFADAGAWGPPPLERRFPFLFFFFHVFTSGSGADPDARGRRMFDLRISEAPLCIHSRLHRWRQQRPGRRLSGQRRR